MLLRARMWRGKLRRDPRRFRVTGEGRLSRKTTTSASRPRELRILVLDLKKATNCLFYSVYSLPVHSLLKMQKIISFLELSSRNERCKIVSTSTPIMPWDNLNQSAFRLV